MSMQSASNKFSITNPTLSTTGAAQTLPAKCHSMLIRNSDASISISVSFDDSVYFSIPAGASLALEGIDISARNTVYIKSASGTPTCQVLYGAEV